MSVIFRKKVRRRVLLGLPPDVSPIGLGLWRTPARDVQRITETAVDLGINFFDTADIYQNHDSETALGRSLRGLKRSDIFVATKFGATDRRGNATIEASLHGALDDSLSRLATDYIDLYQIHGWQPSWPIVEVLHALNSEVLSGRVRSIGACNFSLEQLMYADALCIEQRWTMFASLQLPCNLAMRENVAPLRAYASSRNLSIIGYSPLAGGLLARAVPISSGDEHNDHRREILGLRVAEIAARRGCTPAQVAIAWLLHYVKLQAILMGATSTEQVAANLAALDMIENLSEDLAFNQLAELD